MKQIITGTFAAAVLSVGLAAQAPPQAPPQAAAAAEDAGKAVTVTGCLKAGQTAEAFTLSDLKWKEDKAVGTAGAVTPAAPPVPAASLTLTGNPAGAKLSEHVGHTVEVSGTIEKPMGAPSATAADPAARPSASASPKLNVRTVRMVSTTCQP